MASWRDRYTEDLDDDVNKIADAFSTRGALITVGVVFVLFVAAFVWVAVR